ncbi:MAG: hypothetical protein LCI00_15925 [Chloroflexi bacterium]|nr:hypothetical protein [Chloroflexota bacterium]MCC6892719.1 hypothetical protein [Anaerolineae bacterium]
MPASKKPSNSASPSLPNKKAAWLDAPLPQFSDLELAQLMVDQGCYPSVEDAYIEVPENKLKNVSERANDYLMNYFSSFFWRNSPLPSPKK